MKIRCWSKPGIYLVVLHNNSDKEPTAAIVCFRFSGRLKSQHALKVSRTSWGYTVVELKHITKKSTNQSRVHVREPKCDWPSKDKGLSHDSRAFFSSSFSSSHFLVCLRVFPVKMPFQGNLTNTYKENIYKILQFIRVNLPGVNGALIGGPTYF